MWLLLREFSYYEVKYKSTVRTVLELNWLRSKFILTEHAHDYVAKALSFRQLKVRYIC